MSKVKILIMAFVAVLALSALASASASASTAGWMVNGKLLTGSETAALATTAVVDENAKLTANTITIECEGKTLNGINPKIEAGNMGSATSLVFTECKSISEKCKISSTEIGTVPLLAEATLEGTLGTKVLFSPQSGTTFATIKYEKGTGTCSLEGLKPVTGKVTVTAPTGQDENTLQQIEAATPEGELKIGTASATLKGKALLKLATGQPWSFL